MVGPSGRPDPELKTGGCAGARPIAARYPAHGQGLRVADHLCQRPDLRLGRGCGREIQTSQPQADDRFGGCSRRYGAGTIHCGVARSGFRRPSRIRFHHQGSRRGPPLCRNRRHHLAQGWRDRQQQGPRTDPRHGCAAVGDPGLYPRSGGRGLLHRLFEAPLCVVLHRAWLPVEMQLLPVAANHRRPGLSHPQRPASGQGCARGR